MLRYEIDDDENTSVDITQFGFPEETTQQVQHLQRIIAALDLPISHVALNPPNDVVVRELPEPLAQQLLAEGVGSTVSAQLEVGAWGTDISLCCRFTGDEVFRANSAPLPTEVFRVVEYCGESLEHTDNLSEVFAQDDSVVWSGAASFLECLKETAAKDTCINFNNIPTVDGFQGHPTTPETKNHYGVSCRKQGDLLDTALTQHAYGLTKSSQHIVGYLI